MLNRNILAELLQWKISSERKPLILRGARQVGKTTVVDMFAANFEQYIALNLELEEDALPFKNYKNIQQLVESLFFLKDKDLAKLGNTLLFIDEIQEVPEAIRTLEKMMLLHLIYPTTNTQLPIVPDFRKSPNSL